MLHRAHAADHQQPTAADGQLTASSQAGHPLGGAGDDGEQVVAEGVAEVRAQVLEGPLAGDVGLDEEAQHGEHGQPSVLDLLHLEQRRLVGVGGEAERVEWATWVELVIKFLPEKLTKPLVSTRTPSCGNEYLCFRILTSPLVIL